MQITHSVHALRLPFTVPVAPGVSLERFVNIFMIYGETITLIDTGVAGCEKPIFEYIRSTGRDPSEISLIVQTHSHPDHIGATKAIRAATGCSIAAHPAERAWIENVELQNSERPVPGFSVLVGGSVPMDFDLATAIRLIRMGPGCTRSRFSIPPVIHPVRSPFSCITKESSLPAMQSPSRESFRSTMTHQSRSDP